jgi:hypothetical protein
MSIDLEQLKKAALAAAEHGEMIGESSWYERSAILASVPGWVSDPDAGHIEAADPATVLALVARLERAEAALRVARPNLAMWKMDVSFIDAALGEPIRT